MAREQDIIEFRETFKRPINSVPSLLSGEDMALHVGLILEEYRELVDAYAEGNLVEVFDAILDLRYVLAGLAVHMGLPLAEGERIVHESNMSKLGDDGEPVLREDGKILKGPNWWEANPHLEALLEQVSYE